MSKKNQETIADILREMRNVWAVNYWSEGCKTMNGDYPDVVSITTAELADRIEAAAKRQFREVTKTIPHEEVGNAAAMREALEDARRFVLASAQRTDRDLLIMDEKRGAYVLTPKEILIKIDDALSAPPMEASNIARLRNIIDNISRLNDEWFDTFPTEEGQTGIHDAIICEIVEADKILAAAKGETK